ncbi:MAG TPA: pantoate--beta-alanine ligase [Thermoanaerobaculia bacterium]|nr:pantoate--beta-alanine ligase [Thermoanaerobaculia bacterium]
MVIVRTPFEARRERRALGGSVGFVPTMGALHEGHLSLVRRARDENAHVAASVFVNPAQFGPREDLAAYPRALERDLGLLEREGVALVLAPEAGAMYPSGFETWVAPGRLAERLEGERRPGHFRGVLTVVAKLFNAIEPDRAYFGQKDAQQAILIRRMARDLDFAADIVVCPIVRERDGLAMSSRNVYLSREERRAASVLARALAAASVAWDAGERRGDVLRRAALTVLATEPLANPDYVSAADPSTLQEMDGPADHLLISMAVRFGATRLLDNVVLPHGTAL